MAVDYAMFLNDYDEIEKQGIGGQLDQLDGKTTNMRLRNAMRGSKDFQPRNIEDIIEPNRTLYFKIRNYL